jgi:hypothetical protein
LDFQAEGEALAARQFNEQLKSDPSGQFLELRRIEAALEVSPSPLQVFFFFVKFALQIARIVAQSPNRLFLNSDNLMLSMKVRDKQRMGFVDELVKTPYSSQ